ncbi:hypothetical protein QQ008_15045 [Fulvivirgaceae bacterium BMA10]|uniref:Copper chaperone n=1 Tax=Splendidivirga corallicola TaxID=3051826 RepID=A0ABT8KPP5_9BACT|nr:hypothetical protein [Fulvivirgaceae bacterium BMA10]
MEVFIFKTDISTKKKAKTLKPVFSSHPIITDWSIDTEDIDNVLRVEASENLNENDIITLIKTNGFHCEVLPD